MKEKTYSEFLDAIKKNVKRFYVQPNMFIYDPSNPSSANSLVLIFLRHGEVCSVYLVLLCRVIMWKALNVIPLNR